jgi:hypothetical protein
MRGRQDDSDIEARANRDLKTGMDRNRIALPTFNFPTLLNVSINANTD